MEDNHPSLPFEDNNTVSIQREQNTSYQLPYSCTRNHIPTYKSQHHKNVNGQLPSFNALSGISKINNDNKKDLWSSGSKFNYFKNVGVVEPRIVTKIQTDNTQTKVIQKEPAVTSQSNLLVKSMVTSFENASRNNCPIMTPAMTSFKSLMTSQSTLAHTTATKSRNTMVKYEECKAENKPRKVRTRKTNRNLIKSSTVNEIEFSPIGGQNGRCIKVDSMQIDRCSSTSPPLAAEGESFCPGGNLEHGFFNLKDGKKMKKTRQGVRKVESENKGSGGKNQITEITDARSESSSSTASTSRKDIQESNSGKQFPRETFWDEIQQQEMQKLPSFKSLARCSEVKSGNSDFPTEPASDDKLDNSNSNLNLNSGLTKMNGASRATKWLSKRRKSRGKIKSSVENRNNLEQPKKSEDNRNKNCSCQGKSKIKNNRMSLRNVSGSSDILKKGLNNMDHEVQNKAETRRQASDNNTSVFPWDSKKLPRKLSSNSLQHRKSSKRGTKKNIEDVRSINRQVGGREEDSFSENGHHSSWQKISPINAKRHSNTPMKEASDNDSANANDVIEGESINPASNPQQAGSLLNDLEQENSNAITMPRVSPKRMKTTFQESNQALKYTHNS